MNAMFAYYEREERMNTKGVSFAYTRALEVKETM